MFAIIFILINGMSKYRKNLAYPSLLADIEHSDVFY